MMAKSRSGKTSKGSHEYREGKYLITLMGNNWWYIFTTDGCESGDSIGPDFKTLAAARKWIKANCNQENIAENH